MLAKASADDSGKNQYYLNYQHNISQDELQRIERYLTQSMDSDEADLFELDLKTDPVLKDKTSEVRLLLLGIAEHSLKARLQLYHDEMPGIKTPESKPLVSINRRSWLVAAAVLTVVVTSVWTLFSNRNSYDRLYSEFYQPDPGLPTYMSSTSDYEFDKGMVAYKNKEYDKAIAGWIPLLPSGRHNDTLNYFLGAAYQAIDNEKEALANLSLVVSDTSSVFSKDACWYLGLVHLKNGATDSAVTYIQRSGHPHTNTILDALKTR